MVTDLLPGTRTADQFAAAIGADLIHLLRAIRAERAFESADVCFIAHRKCATALLAFLLHFQRHEMTIG